MKPAKSRNEITLKPTRPSCKIQITYNQSYHNPEPKNKHVSSKTCFM